jgi:retron-type reverse transcriptase
MQLGLFDDPGFVIWCEELFAAYFECRRNKRNSLGALAFERNFEQELFRLAEELHAGTWRPSPSLAFIVRRPVQREVFAAAFRDRVVHHWLIGHLNPHFEALFIDDSYACRVGKGTHYGIRRMQSFITPESFVLKLDIRGFFMHIPRQQLADALDVFIQERLTPELVARVGPVARILACAEAAVGCRIRGTKSDWNGLPLDKSLFTSPAGCGLPIGNLTSQIFANFYLHPFDCYVRDVLGFSRYGRYVDDFVLVDEDRRRLKRAIPAIRSYLRDALGLQLHPKKVYLQHSSKGLPYLGAVVWRTHTIPAKRVRGAFHAAVLACAVPGRDTEQVRCTLASYRGLLQHHAARRFVARRRALLPPDLQPFLVG